MESYYKLARPDGWDFYTGTTINYRAAIGQVVTCSDYLPTVKCGHGLHYSQNPNNGFLGARLQCSAYRVVPCKGVIALSVNVSKARSLLVCEEITDMNTLLGWDYTGLLAFLAQIPALPFMVSDGKPDPSWRVFTRFSIRDAKDVARRAARSAVDGARYPTTRTAALDAAQDTGRAAAGDAARDAAAGTRTTITPATWDAAGDIARDAAAMAMLYVCGDALAPQHQATIRKAWEVWEKGYGHLCTLDNVLYVYGQESLHVAS